MWDYVPAAADHDSIAFTASAAVGTLRLSPFQSATVKQVVAKTLAAASAGKKTAIRVKKNGTVVTTGYIMPADSTNAVVFAIESPLVQGDTYQVEAEGIGAFATLTTALVGANNDVTLNAVADGTAGNSITLALVNPGGNNQALAVSVAGSDISVALATGPAGAITTTAAQLLAALLATPAVVALVTPSLKAGETGVGIVTALAATNLAGGTAGDSSTAVCAVTLAVPK